MRAETEKKIVDLIQRVVSDVRLEKSVQEYLKAELLEVMNCESHETKWGAIDLYKYVSTDKLRPQMCGVHYKDGWRVATDGKILIKLRDEHYPENQEGKTIDKYGVVIDGNYPRYNAVIPQDLSNWDEVQIDYKTLSEVLTRAKTHKKVYGDTKNESKYYLKVDNVFYKLWYFEKFAKALKGNNIRRFFQRANEHMACFKNENIEILLMSCALSEQGLEELAEDESVFIDEL